MKKPVEDARGGIDDAREVGTAHMVHRCAKQPAPGAGHCGHSKRGRLRRELAFRGERSTAAEEDSEAVTNEAFCDAIGGAAAGSRCCTGQSVGTSVKLYVAAGAPKHLVERGGEYTDQD